MKILHIIPSLNKGGAERICLDTCIALQNQGHEVRLITLYPTNQYPFLTQTINHTVVSTQLKLSLYRKNQINVEQLQAVINTFKPDVIHSHLFEAAINLAFCRFPLHTRHIIHFHDNMIQFKKWKWKNLLNKTALTNYYERFLILKNLVSSTQFIGISKDSYSFIQNELPGKKVVLLPNAIDLKRFQPTYKQTKDNTLIMTGSFIPIKGQDLAIRTIKELQERGVKVKLILLGDGKLKQNLLSLCKSLNLEDNVIFEGIVDQPEKYLQNSKIYIHTTYSEAFGLVLIEAMACGLPVVCTDGKGNQDLIREGQNGFLIRERNPELLADKIQYLLENESEIEKMGEYAREFAQKFGIDEYVKKLSVIYSASI